MRIEADSVLSFPRERVFRAYRDELPDFSQFLPNVRKIEVRSRDEAGGTTRLVNVWHGGGEIPAAVRKFLDDSMLSWDDHARWDADAWICEWKIESHAFPEAVICAGKNSFVELANGRTRLEIHGDIQIDVKKIRGVPSFLAGSVGKTVEGFLVKQITANLTSVSDALDRYLATKS